MGRRGRRSGRDVSGILLVDKPAGLSSNAVLQRCKHLFRARKAGHTGNLDLPASGLLPVCFGEATKLSAYLLDSPKRYVAAVALGVRTTTGDASGDVVAEAEVGELSEARVREVLERFRGDIFQVPPMHSALKRGGVRLYELAYAGETVEREPRQVTIHELDLLELQPPRLRIEVACSKGTYIRTLAEDIGEALGCHGHVDSLRRTGVGPFRVDAAADAELLERLARDDPPALDRLLLPPDAAVRELPAVTLSEDAAYYLGRGQAVQVPKAPVTGLLRLYGPQGFLGVGEILDDGRVGIRRLVRG